MKFVIQKVKKASVEIEGNEYSKINKGYMILIGITHSDTKEIADYLINKMISLRIFEDENNKLNLSLEQVNGELLLVSQFTLYGDCIKGNRPSFVQAAKPEFANELYEYIIEECKKRIGVVKTGVFGANMDVSIINEGPVTIILEK